MSFEYQGFATLGVNLNRQKYGPLDISAVFNTQADLDYYLSKGRVTENVSTYWYKDAENKVVPYPYDGQIIATVFDGVKVFALQQIAEGAEHAGEFELVNVGDTSAVEQAIEDINTELSELNLKVTALEEKEDADTTYTFTSGTGGKFTVTPNNGVAQEVDVGITVPTNVSELTNDSGFQNATQVADAIAADLANYYDKTAIEEIKEGLEGKITAIPKFSIEVVEAEDGKPKVETPSTATVYLVPDNDTTTTDVYDEWIYVNGAWELLGKQKLDLSQYALTSYVDGEVKAVSDIVNGLSSNYSETALIVTELEKTVGDADSGLVKDVADLKAVNIPDLIANAKDEAIAAAADAVLVKSVDTSEFTVDADGKLTIKEIASSKISGLDVYSKAETEDAINAAIGNAPTNTGTADEPVWGGATGIYTNIYTKDEIADLIKDVTGGESAASVLAALNAYKGTNDARVLAVEEDIESLQTRVEEAHTRIDTLTINDIVEDFLILDGGNASSDYTTN